MGKGDVQMDEMLDVKLKTVERQAEVYYNRYKKHMQSFESKSMLSKVRSITPYDLFVLGKQLEAFDLQRMIMTEEQGNVNLLGKLPSVAYDVITAVQGASILPVVASVQPIDEEQGIVYFKTTRSATTRGSQTAGNVVVDPRSNIVTPSAYSNNAFESVNAQATAAANLGPYNFTLAGAPVKAESFSCLLSTNTAVKGRDFGPASGSAIGEIFGVGLSGTINYSTGAVSITFSADPGVAQIVVSYQQNYELSTDIPQIDTYFASQSILARVYALKGTMGILQSFGMTKRFGLVAEDELAKDLTVEINRELGGDAVRKLKAVAVGTTTFSRTAPAGVSYFEHKQTYKDALAVADSTLVGNAGRGTISVLIVGRNHASLISTLPGFVKLTDGSTLGSHVFGTLDGITVVRVMESNILAVDEGLALWKGLSPFEAACVYSPYMPLTVTGTLPQSPNPLQSMRAAAVWAGIDALVPNYVTKFNVIP
jgi:hypothetical protein